MVKGRILLADDDAVLRRSYVRLLNRAGYEVVDVEDGRAAAARLHEGQFDALVSDISMPGVDGMELLTLAREADADLPIVLITASPSVATAVRAIERRVLRYLIKPFQTEELESALGDAMRLRRLAVVKRAAEALVRDEAKRADASASALTDTLEKLWMAYQPIFDCKRQQLYAYEALMRSDGELKNPLAILKAAEALDRIHELGRVVRRRVAARVAEAGEETPFFFVNLHPRDLVDDELFDPKAPLSLVAGRIVLEVTERDSLDDVEGLSSRLQRLRALGYRIALDDLGAGYAGLASFIELQPEIVKFDMALIRGLDADKARHTVVSNMRTLCAEFGCLVVAEGVETVGERDALLQIGFELLQGYYLGRPQRFPA